MLFSLFHPEILHSKMVICHLKFNSNVDCNHSATNEAAFVCIFSLRKEIPYTLKPSHPICVSGSSNSISISAHAHAICMSAAARRRRYARPSCMSCVFACAQRRIAHSAILATQTDVRSLSCVCVCVCGFMCSFLACV